MRRVLTFAVVLCLSGLPTRMLAQVTTATILGTVRDVSSLAVPGVSVTVRQEGTGYSRMVTSEADGGFLVPLLPLGPYIVTAERPGFARYVQRGITLELNQNARLDITLSVGSVQDSVTITAAPPLVDTRGSNLGEIINARIMTELPLNGRNPIQLAAFTAGVSTISAPTVNTWTGRNGATLTVDGSRANENDYLLDGQHMFGIFYNTGPNFPAPDALQEFRLITNSYSAEYGRMVGSIFNAVTKSGTNELHATAWEFLRNNALNARNFFAATVPMLRQNQFGATASGPLKKDRLFLFGSYQGLRIRQQQIVTGFPPTAQDRQGFFTEPAGRVLKNPATGLPFPLANPATNTYFIDPANFNPVAMNYLNYVPVAPSTQPFVQLVPVPNNNDQFLIKGDWIVSSANRLAISFFRDRTRSTDPLTGSTFAGYTPSGTRNDVWSASLTDTHTFSPTVLNEGRLHYLRTQDHRSSSMKKTLADFGAVNWNPEGPGLPAQISVSGGFTMGSGGTEEFAEYGYRWQLADTGTWILHSHSLKFGAELMRSLWDIRTYTSAGGLFSFTGAYTNDPMADFFLGRMSQMERGTAIYKDHVSWLQAYFLQDDWRVHPRLTLNLGLRYEISSPFASITNRGTVFRPGQQSVLSPKLPLGMLVIGDPGVPAGIYPTAMDNFAPRIGLAWDPFGNGKTAVRASGGIFYGGTDPDPTTQPGSNPPFGLRMDWFSPAGGLSQPFLGLAQPFPYTINLQDPLFVLPQGLLSDAADFRIPMIYSWHSSIQQQLAGAWMLEASYVGKASEHLGTTNSANPAVFIPGQSTSSNINTRRIYEPGVIAAVNEMASTGHGSYHGLSLTSRVRLQRGLMLTSTYTWSKAIDDISSYTLNSLVNQNPFDRRAEKARSSYDRTHVFSMAGVYDIPGVARYLGNNKAVGFLVDGWELTGLARVASGAPFTITLGYDNSLSGIGLDRPNVVGSMDLPSGRSRGNQILHWFNAAAFAPAPQGSYGNAGRDIGRGPGSANTDLGVFKNFRVPREHWGTVQFRCEFFNVFNQVVLSTPISTYNSGANFGRITSAGSPRIAQFALKYLF